MVVLSFLMGQWQEILLVLSTGKGKWNLEGEKSCQQISSVFKTGMRSCSYWDSKLAEKMCEYPQRNTGSRVVRMSYFSSEFFLQLTFAQQNRWNICTDAFAWIRNKCDAYICVWHTGKCREIRTGIFKGFAGATMHQSDLNTHNVNPSKLLHFARTISTWMLW